MADPKHMAIVNQSIPAWNAWRREEPEVRPDLSEFNFLGAYLHQADFSRTDLRDADISEATLFAVNLRAVTLAGVDPCQGRSEMSTKT